MKTDKFHDYLDERVEFCIDQGLLWKEVDRDQSERWYSRGSEVHWIRAELERRSRK
jgi:hypothetical protein